FVRRQPRADSAGDGLEGLAQLAGLGGVQLDDQATAALQRDTHDDAASLLGDLERSVARPRLHRSHVWLSISVVRFPNCLSPPVAPATGQRCRYGHAA